MDEKPCCKKKTTAFIAGIVLATGLLAWALYSSLGTGSSRSTDFEDFSSEDELESEVSIPEEAPAAESVKKP